MELVSKITSLLMVKTHKMVVIFSAIRKNGIDNGEAYLFLCSKLPYKPSIGLFLSYDPEYHNLFCDCLSIHSFSFLWILKIFPEHFFVTYILCLFVYMACVCAYMYICVCAYMYICVCIVFYMMCTAGCRHLLIKVYKYQVLHLCFPLSKKKLKVIIIVTCNIIYSFLQHMMFFFL